MSLPYLSLLEALRVNCNLPEFPDPLPSTQLDLELENGPTVTIDFDEETEFVEVFSQIGTYTPDRELEVLKKIAEANFLWNSTAGGTLSIRPEIQTVYFAYQTPVLNLNGMDFVQLIEKFVEVISQWQKFLLADMGTTPIVHDENGIAPIIESCSLPTPGNNNFIIG